MFSYMQSLIPEVPEHNMAINTKYIWMNDE